VEDTHTLHQAFNSSRREPGGEFSVASAIDWIFDLPGRQAAIGMAASASTSSSGSAASATIPALSAASAVPAGMQPDVVAQNVENQRARTPQVKHCKQVRENLLRLFPLQKFNKRQPNSQSGNVPNFSISGYNIHSV
jgi:hypothetical protein